MVNHLPFNLSFTSKMNTTKHEVTHSGNATENSWVFIISNPSERHVLLFYISLAALFSIMGNSFVIYATSQYNSTTQQFSMAKPTIFMIKQLAIADLLFCLLIIVPHVTTLIYSSWVLGHVVCQVMIYCHDIPAISSVSFIFAISLHRYMRCHDPVRRRLFSVKGIGSSLLLAGIIWTWSSLKTILKLALRVDTTVSEVENEVGVHCMIANHNRQHHTLLSWINVLQTDLPILLTIGLNIKLLHFARKKFRSLPHNNKTAILTTASICLVLLASHTVREVTEILYHVFGVKPSFTVRKLSTCLYYLNAFCNSFLYIMVNKGFRTFAKDVVVKKRKQLSVKLSSRLDFSRSSTRTLLNVFMKRGSDSVVTSDTVQVVTVAQGEVLR